MLRALALLVVLVGTAPAQKLMPGAATPSNSSVYVEHAHPNGVGDAGTGTVIECKNNKSLIITCAHVVEDGKDVLTVTANGKTYPAKFKAGSRVRNIGPNMIAIDGPDLALLVVDAKLPAVPLAAKEPALGDALRLWGFGGRTARQGFVQKAGRVVAGPNFVKRELCHTIDSISGDSGSGVFNSAGELVGVHHGKAEHGYATPLETIKKFLRDHP